MPINTAKAAGHSDWLVKSGWLNLLVTDEVLSELRSRVKVKVAVLGPRR